MVRELVHDPMFLGIRYQIKTRLGGVFNKHIEILLTKRKSNAILSVTICRQKI